MTHNISQAAIFILAMLWLVIAAPLNAQIRVVAATGDSAPGTEPNTQFQSLSTASINANGQTFFYGSLTGDSVNSNNNVGIWSEAAGDELRFVARSGFPAPGTSSNFSNFSFGNTPFYNDSHQFVFMEFLDAPSNVNRGIWFGQSGTPLSLIARNGEQAPGTLSGTSFDLFQTTSINAHGETAFRARLAGPGVDSTNNFGIWKVLDGSGPALSVRNGDQAEGLAVGIVYTFFIESSLNDLGQIAFIGDLTGPGVNNTNASGIWSEGSREGFSLIVRSGDSATGIGGGVVHRALFTPVLNNAGCVAFGGTLAGPGVTLDSNTAYWAQEANDSHSSVSLIAREGDPAPGTEAGVTFGELFGFTLTMNDHGKIAFVGRLNGPGVNATNDQGIWSKEPDGNLRMVAREGQPAPGVMGEAAIIDIPQSIGLNNLGQIAFAANLTGNSIDSTNDRGLWVEDTSGELTLIMQKGDLVDINSDLATKDLREVRFLNFNPFSGFSDAGHIAIQATFSDFDSAIFVSYAVANLVVGDVNQDSLINLLDIEPFVELLSSGFFQAEADINQDGLVNLLDIEGFVSLLSGGG